MIKVHGWLPDESHVGHTAITIRDTYISFWPAPNQKLKLKIKKDGAIGSLNKDLKSDIHDKGDRLPKNMWLTHLDE